MRRSAFGRRNAILGSRYSRAGLALLGFVLVVVVVRVTMPGAISSLLAPISYAGTGLANGVAGVGSMVTGPAALESELAEARAYGASMEEQNRVLRARVQDLENLLGDRVDPPKGILAGVIAKPPQSPYDALLIDQGTDAGVAVGAQVTSNGGIPIGKIASVTARSARVTLYSAPEVVTEAWIGDGRTPLTMTGTGAGTYAARAPREAVIATGNLAYVPGPGSVPIATVSRIDSDPADPSVTVHLKSLSNPFTISWVMVAPLTAMP